MSGKENTASTGKSRKPVRPSPMAKHSSKSSKETPEDVENTNPDGKELPSAKVRAAKAKARAKSVPRQVMQEKSQQLQGDQLKVKATVVPQAGITLSMSRSLMNESTTPIKLTAPPVAEETSCISAMEKLSLQDTGSASDPPVDRSTRYVPPSQRSGYSDHSKQIVTDDDHQPDTTVQLDQTESVPQQHGSPQTGPQTPPRQYQKPVYAPHSPPAYYHDYHAPYQPMYPPYTPHPIYHDPSVRYNSQAYGPQPPTGYAPGPYYSGGYPVADPCEMPYPQTQGHPGYGVGPNQEFWPVGSYSPRPDHQAIIRSRGASTNMWRRESLSVRQMASICFQASSKGTAAQLPKERVRALVQHQLESQEPVHAPWYRHYQGDPSRSLGSAADETGTGVWLPEDE